MSKRITIIKAIVTSLKCIAVGENPKVAFHVSFEIRKYVNALVAMGVTKEEIMDGLNKDRLNDYKSPQSY